MVVGAGVTYAVVMDRVESALNAPMSEVPSDEVLEVKKGTSLRRLLSELETRGLVISAQEA